MSKQSKFQQIKILLGSKNEVPTLWLFENQKIFAGFHNENENEVTEQQFNERYNAKTDLMIFLANSIFTEKYKDFGRCIVLYSS